jgi:hypothetical protein
MHKEEFYYTLLEDEFIKDLILQIETISVSLKIEEINQLIRDIRSPAVHEHEMTRFSEYLTAQLKSFIDSDLEDCGEGLNQLSEENYEEDYSPNENEKCSSISPTNQKGKSNRPVGKEVGIDELLEYIEADHKPKKSKKKKSAKKKKKTATNENTNSNVNQCTGNRHHHREASGVPLQELDKEIENFKKSIIENNFNGKRIRPIITKDWLIDLQGKISCNVK